MCKSSVFKTYMVSKMVEVTWIYFRIHVKVLLKLSVLEIPNYNLNTNTIKKSNYSLYILIATSYIECLP